MKDLKTIESRVRAILSNHQEARDDDMILYLLYCNRYGEVRVRRKERLCTRISMYQLSRSSC